MSGVSGIPKRLLRVLTEERAVSVGPTDISKCFSGERPLSCTLFSVFLVFFDCGVGLPSAVSAVSKPTSGLFLLRLLLELFV